MVRCRYKTSLWQVVILYSLRLHPPSKFRIYNITKCKKKLMPLEQFSFKESWNICIDINKHNLFYFKMKFQKHIILISGKENYGRLNSERINCQRKLFGYWNQKTIVFISGKYLLAVKFSLSLSLSLSLSKSKRKLKKTLFQWECFKSYAYY